MNPDEAGEIARKVTAHVADRDRSTADSPEQEERVREEAKRIGDAFYEQATEFIPDGADVCVDFTDDDDRQPVAIAVHQQQVYVLGIGRITDSRVVTTCRLSHVSSDRGTATAEARYWKRETSGGSPARETTWKFRLCALDLTIHGGHSPGAGSIDNERVAQAIATLVGWEQLPLHRPGD